jgi:hypothetical protein
MKAATFVFLLAVCGVVMCAQSRAIVVAYTKDNLAHVSYPGGISKEDGSMTCPC